MVAPDVHKADRDQVVSQVEFGTGDGHGEHRVVRDLRVAGPPRDVPVASLGDRVAGVFDEPKRVVTLPAFGDACVNDVDDLFAAGAPRGVAVGNFRLNTRQRQGNQARQEMFCFSLVEFPFC